MNWLVYAVIAPLLWSIDVHIDKHVLGRFYANVKPATVMFFSAVINGLFSLFILLLDPRAAHISLQSGLVILVAGAIYFFAPFPYFYALKHDETSRVVPLFQAQPIFAYIFGALFLHEALNFHEVTAGVVIIVGALLMNVDLDNGYKIKQRSFWLMMLSTGLFATGAFLFNFIGDKYGFWATSYYQNLGTAAAGLGLFIFGHQSRRDLITVLKTYGTKAASMGFLTEIINTAARVAFNYATLLAPLALVTLISGLQPAFVFLIGIALTIFFPKYGKENLQKKHFLQKLMSILIILAGTYFLIY